MMKVSLLIIASVLVVMIQKYNGTEDVTKENKEISIGNQVWMVKNLNVDKFCNGESIPHAKTGEEWIEAAKNKQPAWCYYDNDSVNSEKYGKLYNWYAVNDARGLAPKGWHIPSDSEWNAIYIELGKQGGNKMKNNSGWYNNGNGSNESGFSGLPGGRCSPWPSFTFTEIGRLGCWWSSSEAGSNLAWFRYLAYAENNLSRHHQHKQNGLSVRCIKD